MEYSKKERLSWRKSLVKLFFVLSIILGVFLRLKLTNESLSKTTHFFDDYGRDILVAKNLFKNNLFLAPNSSFEALKNTPLYYWILAVSYWLAGENGIKLFFFLIGLLTIFLAYVLGEKINKKGLIFSSLLATSLVFKNLTHDIWQPTLIPFFILLSIYFLVMYETKKKMKYLSLVIIFYSCSIFIHYSAIFLLPVFLISSTHITCKIKPLSSRIRVFILSIGMSLVFASLFFYSLSKSSLENNSFHFFTTLDTITQSSLHFSQNDFSKIYQSTSLLIDKFLYIPAAFFSIIISFIAYLKYKNKWSLQISEMIFLFWAPLSLLFVFLTPNKIVPEHYLSAFFPLIIFYPAFLFDRGKILNYFGSMWIFIIIIFNVIAQFNILKSDQLFLDFTDQYNHITSFFIDYGEKNNINLSAIYSVDQYCFENFEISPKYCIYSSWNSAYVWYGIEEKLKKDLVKHPFYEDNSLSI